MGDTALKSVIVMLDAQGSRMKMTTLKLTLGMRMGKFLILL
jgi:hypothetical protein